MTAVAGFLLLKSVMNARVMSILSAGFGKSLEGFTNLFLQGCKKLLPATIVCGLRIFTFALSIFLQLVELIDLRLQRSWIDGRSSRRVP